MYKTKVENIEVYASRRYYDVGERNIVRAVKNKIPMFLSKASSRMAKSMPTDKHLGCHWNDCVLVPVPGHKGNADVNLILAEQIGEKLGMEVVDALCGAERKSQYLTKKAGSTLTEEEFGFKLKTPIPDGKKAILIEDVVDTGATISAAVNALKGVDAVVMSYTIGF